MKNKVCIQCVMDETDKGISFDSLGVCNYCNEHEKVRKNYIFTSEQELNNLKTISNLFVIHHIHPFFEIDSKTLER